MKTHIHINLAQVVSIEVHLKKVNMNIEYSSYKKLFGFIKLWEDGLYGYDRDSQAHVLVDPEGIELPGYVENNVVYYKPHLVYNLSDGSSHIQYYEAENLLRAELNDLIEGREFIKILE